MSMAYHHHYWQRDSRHKDLHLGMPRSTATIGEQGCKLCCYADILGVEPANLQNIFAANGCYANDAARWYNYILDEQVARVFAGRLHYNGRVDCQTTPAPLELVRDQLARNGWCMIYVDARQNMTPDVRIKYRDYFQHYCLVTALTPRGFEIFDPFVGDVAQLCPRYGRTDSEAIGGVIKLDRVVAVPAFRLGEQAKIEYGDRFGWGTITA